MDGAAVLQRMGGARAILATATSDDAMPGLPIEQVGLSSSESQTVFHRASVVRK